MKLRAIIIEDEEAGRIVLSEMLKSIAPEVEIVGTASSYFQIIELMNEAIYDIAFLDIQLGNFNIFEILNAVKPSKARYIFTTAYSEFALPAIKAGCIDYLTKPILFADLRVAIDKSLTNSDIINIAAVNNLTELAKLNKLVISNQSGLEIYPLENILYLSAESNYTKIHLDSNKTTLASKSLVHYGRTLPTDMFFRIHSSYMVNIHKIRKIGRGKDPFVSLIDNTILEVSRNRKHELLKLFL